MLGILQICVPSSNEYGNINMESHFSCSMMRSRSSVSSTPMISISRLRISSVMNANRSISSPSTRQSDSSGIMSMFRHSHAASTNSGRSEARHSQKISPSKLRETMTRISSVSSIRHSLVPRIHSRSPMQMRRSQSDRTNHSHVSKSSMLTGKRSI